jgi:Bifunctional DNA primase/polymerase, N-terminal
MMRDVPDDRDDQDSVRPITSVEAAVLAANLAKSCGYAVFPVRADKTPVWPKANGGQGYKDASRDPERIAWLWRKWPGPLVGVATGAISGIDLLDVDCGNWAVDASPTTIEKHESARAWWHANHYRLPETLTFRSRSRGLHLYLAHSDVVGCTTSKITKGIDTRANGGYAIWWFAAGYDCLHYSRPAPWPAWLLAAMAPPPALPRRAYSPRPGDDTGSVAGLLRTVAGAAEGERNTILHWAACRFAERVCAGQISAAEAEVRLVAAGLAAGLEEPGARATARSGLRSAA